MKRILKYMSSTISLLFFWWLLIFFATQKMGKAESSLHGLLKNEMVFTIGIGWGVIILSVLIIAYVNYLKGKKVRNMANFYWKDSML